METNDAHEDILVVGQVGHCLEILDVGMLFRIAYQKIFEVYTGIYMYIV